jgi:hypothetical protein
MNIILPLALIASLVLFPWWATYTLGLVAFFFSVGIVPFIVLLFLVLIVSSPFVWLLLLGILLTFLFSHIIRARLLN